MDWSRRQFGTMLTMGAGALMLSAQEEKKLGFCVVGLGRISNLFMGGTKIAKAGKVVALVSGHPDKAARYASQYGVPAGSIYNYQDYDRIAANKDIDAVYIGLPNNMHAEYTIRAAKAGKHVLCEKPMATTAADSQAMIDACKKADRKLMIAYRCQYDPVHLHAVQLIRDGKIGKVQSIEAGFGFNIAPGEWRLNKTMAGGGPLMDVGIYCLNACRYLTGEEPTELKGYSSVVDQDGRFKDVEENLSWSMKFPSGAVASCATTYGSNLTGYFRVWGSRGTLSIDPAFNYDGQHLIARVQGGPPIDETNPVRSPGFFAPQIDHFADCVFNNKQPKSAGEEGLRDMKLMAAIYKSCQQA